MKKLLTSFWIILLIHNLSFAQDLPSIQTDRPDQTECPFIVPVNYVQLENGFSYEKTDRFSEEIIAPTILTRFGINDHFELRLITENVINKNNSGNVNGITPIYVGFKTRLLQEKGIVPTTSFIAHLSLPKLASKSFKTTYYAPEFRFTMQHTVSEKQTLSYNLGAEWDGDTAEPIFVYTLTTGYALTEKIGGYVELYGFLPQTQKPDHRFDAGFTYLFNPNHQLDLSGGVGISKNAPDYFISVGYSFRFKM